MGKTLQLAVGVCCCLQACNSVLNMLIMGVRTLMVIRVSTTGILLYAKVHISSL